MLEELAEPISNMAILWPGKAIFEKRAATMEVDTFISPTIFVQLRQCLCFWDLPDHLSGRFRRHFCGHLRGTLEAFMRCTSRAENRECQPLWLLSWALLWALLWAHSWVKFRSRLLCASPKQGAAERSGDQSSLVMMLP